MGVMNCDRNNCSSIMCQTYISEIGYICSECKTEFKEYLHQKENILATEADIIKRLSLFMLTYKNICSKKEITVDQFFADHTD